MHDTWAGVQTLDSSQKGLGVSKSKNEEATDTLRRLA